MQHAYQDCSEHSRNRHTGRTRLPRRPSGSICPATVFPWSVRSPDSSPRMRSRHAKRRISDASATTRSASTARKRGRDSDGYSMRSTGFQPVRSDQSACPLPLPAMHATIRRPTAPIFVFYPYLCLRIIPAPPRVCGLSAQRGEGGQAETIRRAVRRNNPHDQPEPL